MAYIKKLKLANKTCCSERLRGVIMIEDVESVRANCGTHRSQEPLPTPSCFQIFLILLQVKQG